jgi:hypothetical protein
LKHPAGFILLHCSSAKGIANRPSQGAMEYMEHIDISAEGGKT